MTNEELKIIDNALKKWEQNKTVREYAAVHTLKMELLNNQSNTPTDSYEVSQDE